MTTNQAFMLLKKLLDRGLDLWAYNLPFEPHKSKIMGIEISDRANETNMHRYRKWVKLEKGIIIDFRSSIDKIKVIDYRGVPRRLFKIGVLNGVDSMILSTVGFVLKIATNEAMPGDLLDIDGNLYPVINITHLIDSHDYNTLGEKYHEVVYYIHDKHLVDILKINTKDKNIYFYTLLNNLNNENQ